MRRRLSIHPKGTGVVVVDEGIPAHEFVSEYIGELYPPWRWFERQDAVASAQRALDMPPSLPTTTSSWSARATTRRAAMDSLRGRVEACQLLVESVFHSCTPNCEPRMAVRQVASASCSPRSLLRRRELTFDYVR